MSTRKQQAEQTRQKILEAVYRLVREDGIHSLSSVRIIEAAGVSKGGFFHHFPQMEDLYLYMLDQFLQQFDAEMAPGNFRTFRQFMRSTTDYMFEVLEQAPETITPIFYFLSQSQQKPEYKVRLQSLLENTFSRWAEDIARYFSTNLSAARKDRLVRLLDMYFLGFSVHHLILGERKRYRAISDDLADMLVAWVGDKEAK